MSPTKKYLGELRLILDRLSEINAACTSHQSTIDVLGQLKIDFDTFMLSWWKDTYRLIIGEPVLYEARTIAHKADDALLNNQFSDAEPLLVRVFTLIETYLEMRK